MDDLAGVKAPRKNSTTAWFTKRPCGGGTLETPGALMSCVQPAAAPAPINTSTAKSTCSWIKKEFSSSDSPEERLRTSVANEIERGHCRAFQRISAARRRMLRDNLHCEGNNSLSQAPLGMIKHVFART